MLLWSIVAWSIGVLVDDGIHPFDASATHGDLLVMWPFGPTIQMTLLSFAVWLSVPRWHTRERIALAGWILGGMGFVLAMLQRSALDLAIVMVADELRKLPRPMPEDDAPMLTGEPIDCLECGGRMAGDAKECRACGWTFAT